MKISSTWNQDQGDQEKFKLNEFSKKCFDVIEHAEYTMKLVINKVALGKSSSIDIPQYFLQSDPLAGKSWFTFSTIKKLYYPLSIVRMDEADNSYGGISNRNITDDGGSTAKVERVPHMKVCLMIRSECNNEENEPEDFMTQTTVLGGIYWFTAIRSVHVSGRVLIRFSCPDAPHVRPLIFRVPIILQSSPTSLSTEFVLQENAARSVSSSKKRRKRQIQSSNSKAPTSPNSVKERQNLNSNHREEEEVSQYAIQEIPSHSDISSGMNWKQNDDHTSGRRVDMRADNCASHQSLKFDWENHFDHTVCGHYIIETYATCRYRKYTCTRCGTKFYNKNHALQHIADRTPPCLTMTSVKVVSCPDPIQAVKELILDYWAQEDVDVGEVILDGCHPDETSTDSNRNSIHQCSNVPIVDVTSSVEGEGVPQGISDAVPHTVTTAHLENSSMGLNFDALRSSTVGNGHESLESTGKEEEEVSQYAIQEIPSHSDISSGMNWKQNDDHTSGRRVDMRADNCASHQSLKFDWENHFDHTVCGHYIIETYATCRYRKYTCTRCGTKLYNKNHALQHIADRKPPCLTMTSVKVVSCPIPIQAVKELILDYWAQEDVRKGKDVGEVILDGCHPDETSTDSNRNSIHQCSNVPIVDVSSSVEGGGVPQGISDAVPHTVTTAHLENSSMDFNFDALRSSTVGHGHESLESTGKEPCQGTPGPWQQNSQPCNDDNQSPQSITSTATEMQLLLGPLEVEVPSKETMSDGLYHPSSAINDSFTVRTVTETTHTTPMIDNLLSAAAYTMKLVIHADSGNGIVGGICIPNTFQQSRPLPGCGSSWFTLAVTPQEGLYYPLSIARMDEADNGNSNGNSNATKVCLTIRSECSDALDQPEDFTTQTTAMGGIFWFIAVRSVHVSGRVLIHFSCPDAPHVRPLSFRVPIISLPKKPLQFLTQSCFKNTSQHAVRSPGQQHSDAASAGNQLISPTIWQIRSPASSVIINKDELAERSVSFESHRRGCTSEKDNGNASGNIRARSLFPCCRDSGRPHTITPIESETQSETVTATIYVDFEKRALHQIES